jgi:hypothetical protein
MKRPNAFLRFATIAGSILLVSGFISYRAGAVNWLMGIPSRSQNWENVQENNSEHPDVSKEAEPQTGRIVFMLGPKSDAGLQGHPLFDNQGGEGSHDETSK